MKRLSNTEFRKHFLGWQCRVRQIAMRDYSGRPLPPMMPRISTRKGEVVIPAMVTLLIHSDPVDVTNYLRFISQKSHDPQIVRDNGLKLLAADYYQDPEHFSDQLVAVFSPDSETAARLLKLKTVVMDFDGFGQSYRMFAAPRMLKPSDSARDAALWHNRLFNPNLSAEAAVLGFAPDWQTAQADPLP